MAEVLNVMRENDIPFVVAPFEADWQLAYMFHKKIIHAIATTDSDFWALLDYPCILFNLSADLKAFVAASGSIHKADEQREKPFHHLTRFGAIVRTAV